jgi:hypothetical protein
LFAKFQSSSVLLYWPSIPMQSLLYPHRSQLFSRRISTYGLLRLRSNCPGLIFFNTGTSVFIAIQATNGLGRFLEHSSEGLLNESITKPLEHLKLHPKQPKESAWHRYQLGGRTLVMLAA